MEILFIIFLLVCAVFLEGTFFALPLVLVLLVVLQIAYKSGSVVVAAFLTGLLLDTLLFRPLGQSSLFFLSFLTLLALYERRFEVQTYPFLLGSVLVGTSAYLLLFESGVFFVQLTIALVFGLVLFIILVRKSEKSSERLASR